MQMEDQSQESPSFITQRTGLQERKKYPQTPNGLPCTLLQTFPTLHPQGYTNTHLQPLHSFSSRFPLTLTITLPTRARSHTAPKTRARLAPDPTLALAHLQRPRLTLAHVRPTTLTLAQPQTLTTHYRSLPDPQKTPELTCKHSRPMPAYL